MVDNTIYIDTTTVDSSTSTHSSTGSSTSMRPENEFNVLDQLKKELGPEDTSATVEERTKEKLRQIDTLKGFVKDDSSSFTLDDRGIVYSDQEEAERARERGSKAIGRRFRGIEINTNHPDTIPAPIEINTNESNLGDKLATVDEGLATAFHTVHQFFKGGLYQVYKDQGAELPEWTHKVAGVLNNPDYNQAMSMGAFLTYGKAPGLNKDNMLKAIAMKEEGATHEQIFQATGAEHYEGKWGEKVPWSGLQVKTTSIKGTQPLENLVDHPEVFKADPSLKNIPVRHMTPEEIVDNPTTHGFTDRDGTFIAIRPGLTSDQFKQAIVHETEHVIQHNHGLPGGSAPNMFKDTEYYLLEKTRDEQVKTIDNKLYALHDRDAKMTLPQGGELIPEMATIAIKGKYTPNRLTTEEMATYKDILKYGLSKDLESLRYTQNRLHAKDWENEAKYNKTKGEVGARVGEQELDLTKNEANAVSYKRFMEAMVPEKQRINSPLDAGNSHSVVPPKDFPKELKASNENTAPKPVDKDVFDRLSDRQTDRSKYLEAIQTQRDNLIRKDLLKFEPMDRAERTYTFTMGGKGEKIPQGHVTLTKGSDPKKPFIVASYDDKGKLTMHYSYSSEKWARKTFEDWKR